MLEASCLDSRHPQDWSITVTFLGTRTGWATFRKLFPRSSYVPEWNKLHIGNVCFQVKWVWELTGERGHFCVDFNKVPPGFCVDNKIGEVPIIRILKLLVRWNPERNWSCVISTLLPYLQPGRMGCRQYLWVPTVCSMDFHGYSDSGLSMWYTLLLLMGCQYTFVTSDWGSSAIEGPSLYTKS